ncbi:AAA family ATPase [Amycolatopsis acidiphila]|uniref:AAA family ATPase n=1 Tax=Amycolatopsis acidiphila TaxID=715473 RepID=A0A558A191_9PSEU|nr:AAA family ATPase [Amycolatopsis acidiphila]TVT18033.1 AAA family ATPase [Amycolatopsis acidiphila]UIJ63757.1 AAA family ATPase [Amycolatopsis acidiphila]
MKVAFVGKGGSGKTTLTSLFAAHLVASGKPVLAIDADINQHLAAALGASEEEAMALPTLGDHLPLIKEHLRGDNPRIASADAMIKTTPPGRGSRLLRPFADDDPVLATCFRTIGGVRLGVTGRFTEDDLGVACYHSKVGAAELLLNHLIDEPGEYVVLDMTAGADAFASGLFTRFDVTFLVCEPTLRSVGVYRQYADYARDFGVRLAVVGNKVTDDEDVAFLRDQLGDALSCWLTGSRHVRAAERGQVRSIDALEPHNLDALAKLVSTVDSAGRDWARYHRQAVEFHLRNARSWGNDRTGQDLAAQVDPEFVPGPAALARA